MIIMKKIKQKIKANKGIVIVFALLISTIFLIVSLGVSNIALKETKFSISGKDTNEAIFAADAGVECALLYDRYTGTTANRFAYTNQGGAMTCAGSSPFTPTQTIFDANHWAYDFTVPNLGSSGKACSIVTIDKNNTIPPLAVTITSNGYNVGSSGSTCSSNSSNLVARQLQVIYGGYDSASGGGNNGGGSHTVTGVVDSGSGTIVPESQTTSGAPVSFNLTESLGWKIYSASGCEGTLAGKTYTTGIINNNCTVHAVFVVDNGGGGGGGGGGCVPGDPRCDPCALTGGAIMSVAGDPCGGGGGIE